MAPDSELANLRAVLSAGSVASILLDNAGRTRCLTPPASKLLRHRRGIIGRPLVKALPQELRPGWDEDFQGFLRFRSEIERTLEARRTGPLVRRIHLVPEPLRHPLRCAVVTFSALAAGSEDQRLLLAIAGTTGALWDVVMDPNRPDELPDTAYLSPEMKALVGCAPGEMANSRSAWRHYVLPEDRARVELAAQETLSGRSPMYDVEYRVRHRDGQTRWIHGRGMLLRDDRGQPTRCTGMSWDITDRKRAENQRLRLAVLVESSDDAIITKDLDGTITSWNHGAELIYGYSAEEAMGRPISLLIPPESPESQQLPEIMARIGRGEQVRIEVIRRRKDGRDIPIALTVAPVFDERGVLTGASAIGRDISEQKRVEAELRSLNESLEQRVRQRTRLLDLLQSAATIANQSKNTTEAIAAAIELLCDRLGWDAAHAYLLPEESAAALVDTGIWHARSHAPWLRRLRTLTERTVAKPGKCLPGRVFATGEAEWLCVGPDAACLRRPGETGLEIGSALAFAIRVGERVVGVVELFRTAGAEADEELLRVLPNVGEQLGRTVERQWLQRDLIDAVWQQQLRLGHEVHDGLGQVIMGTRLMADSLHTKLRADGSPLSTRAAELVDSTQQAQRQVTELVRGLFPVEIDAQGLMHALEGYALSAARLYGIPTIFRCQKAVLIEDNSTATHLFRIAQEAVRSAVRAVRPDQITIRLARDDGDVVLAVSCSGGRRAESGEDSQIGWRIMQYRAGVIGATLDVGAGTDGGLVVTCRLRQERLNGAAEQERQRGSHQG